MRRIIFWVLGLALIICLGLFVKIPMTVVVGDKTILYEPSYISWKNSPAPITVYIFSRGKIFEIQKHTPPESLPNEILGL